MCGPAVKEKPCRRAIWLLFARTYRTSGLVDEPAHRGLKIYAALTWDRGFELLHRAQRHTNPIDPRPRLNALAYLGRAGRHADQLSWNWIRVVHALRWCRGDLSTAPNQPPRHGGHDGPKHRNRAGRSHI